MSEQRQAEGISRRELLGKAAAGTAAIGIGASIGGTLPTAAMSATKPAAKPRAGMNVLVVMVDQMRAPNSWLSPQQIARHMPNLDRLMRRSVRFDSHYTASNACSPARSTITTGLYTHQTGMYITQELKSDGMIGGASPDMNPAFPTYGSMLRSVGYETNWIGKWHLSADCDYEPYGFSGLTCPSPNGGPGEGLTQDRKIAGQFEGWIASRRPSDGPWCSTVSLVNPHDIAFYPRFTKHTPVENNPPRVFRRKPANFETPRDLLARRKPFSQRGLQQAEAVAVGAMPFHGRKANEAWADMLNTYLLMHRMVDRQIGRVMKALEARPEIARNTIVMFMADHGEYAGAHGLRGKGAAAYDEAIHVPFSVYDPSGTWVSKPGRSRQQLTSSVDIAPLMMTLATGNGAWRKDPRWSHLSSRLRIEKILKRPGAKGRPYVLHATDERLVEEGPTAFLGGGGPTHISGIRTAAGKFVTYSYWKDGTVIPRAKGMQKEAYAYSRRRGRLELDNEMRKPPRRRAPVAKRLEARLKRAERTELRAPLPPELETARKQAVADYLAYAASTASG